MNLEEFADVIDEWVIEEFKKAGFGTAREVLSVSREELISRVDVEEETIDDVLTILAAEFNEEMLDGENEETAEDEEQFAEGEEETTESEAVEENTETEEQL